ncbi:hypothetical protein C8F04DRAFT_1195016 [Mycena alexandri]|uniref:Uncharacterized protein n=1 Tax=Mycena alexandri TaxID=1745969 RepID=A0AAD6WR06_9AGAR|nr:hypothetical protein C8F04DRAFT_1195016 [Mycena alexandri]
MCQFFRPTSDRTLLALRAVLPVPNLTLSQTLESDMHMGRRASTPSCEDRRGGRGGSRLNWSVMGARRGRERIECSIVGLCGNAAVSTFSFFSKVAVSLTIVSTTKCDRIMPHSGYRDGRRKSSPDMTVFLYLASQTILAIRTYAVSRRSPTILRVLITLFLLCALGEFISTFWKRVHSASPYQGKGFVGVTDSSFTRVFDVVALTITGVYLWKFSNASRASSRLARMILEDGIMYFIALTAMNIVNLVFLQSRDTTLQSSASSLGFATTMIFSSRFILNLSERSRDGISGDNSHSSRTPASGGRRGPNHTMAGTTSEGIVVNVVKNVITMKDMVGATSELKAGEWAREDNSMA